MKTKLRMITVATTALGALLFGQVSFAAPIVPNLGSPAFPVAAQPALTCAVQASIKATSTKQNEVTYSITYNSTKAVAGAPYVVTASTVVPTHTISQFSKMGKANLAIGAHTAAQDGVESVKFTFSTEASNVKDVTVKATLNGVQCTAKTLQVVRPSAAAAFVVQPTLQLPSFTIPDLTTINVPARVATCIIYKQATGTTDGGAVVGVALAYKNVDKGNHTYEINGQLMTNGAATQRHSGNFSRATYGDGVVTSNGRAFIFNVPAGNTNAKFQVTAKIDNVSCPSQTLAVPAGAAAPAENGGNNNGGAVNNPPVVNPPAGNNGGGSGTVNGGSSGSVGGSTNGSTNGSSTGGATNSGTGTPDSGTAAGQNTSTDSSVLAQGDADDVFATESGIVDPDSNWKDYVVYGILALIAAGAVGYGIYAVGRRTQRIG